LDTGVNITHLGGESTVTGSCHLFRAKGLNILVDCGMAQGDDAVLPMERWPLQPSEIDYLFLTHAHIDHMGRVPELIRRGFRGEILTTHATKALLGPMLEDALGFQDLSEKETESLLKEIDRLSWGFEYYDAFDLEKGVRFRLGRAGHILGSCWIRFDIPFEGSVVFSGDLGAKHTPILCDPDIPEGCDLLILESTYGDRLHGDRQDRTRRLGEVLTRALKDQGKVLVPAFALGRTQELIYEIDRLFSDPPLEIQNPKRKIPVFIDSPLGLEITKIYKRLSEYWDREARDLLKEGDHPMDFDHLYAVRNHQDHLKLCNVDGPVIILAGSGMCTGGRIVEHLKRGLEDRRNDVLFVGYQARGTPGRDILRYSRRPGGYVILKGERFEIKAKVHSLAGYSAHADQRGLVEWVGSIPEKPRKIKLVHGEANAQKALGKVLFERGYDVQ